uniref:Uncharacterized protein n=1 Tax=Brassica oleracea TaxID=3712 RepID=A0A3P6BTE4_BRAOL|nr:unnamed protein product [Brassica oleracea]
MLMPMHQFKLVHHQPYSVSLLLALPVHCQVLFLVVHLPLFLPDSRQGKPTFSVLVLPHPQQEEIALQALPLNIHSEQAH